MKIRNGFVSNSSSSSYIVLFPPKFDLDSINWEKEYKDYQDNNKQYQDQFNPEGNVWNALYQLKHYGDMSDEEFGDDVFRMILDVLDQYIIATVRAEASCSTIAVANPEKVAKILGLK